VLNAAEWPHCQLRIGEKIRTTPGMIKVMGTALPRQLKLLSLWGRQDPRRSHWHLGPIGVAPELHGRGIGKALLASSLEMVDEHDSPAISRLMSIKMSRSMSGSVSKSSRMPTSRA